MMTYLKYNRKVWNRWTRIAVSNVILLCSWIIWLACKIYLLHDKWIISTTTHKIIWRSLHGLHALCNCNITPIFYNLRIVLCEKAINFIITNYTTLGTLLSFQGCVICFLWVLSRVVLSFHLLCCKSLLCLLWWASFRFINVFVTNSEHV